MHEIESLAAAGDGIPMPAADRAEPSQGAATSRAASSLRALGRPLLAFTASTGALCASGSAVTRGVVPQGVGGWLVTAAYVAVVASTFHVGQVLGPFARDESGARRPLWRRHGFWLVAIAAALYVPTLGAASLWDPWESQYGEVAREILVRGDWLSLWWAHDGFFYSKPAFTFWTQAVSLALLGARIRPDHVLDAGARPEWAVRLPNVLLAILALYILYRATARVFGRRAGLLGGLAVATSAHWFLLARHSTTDMPFVAMMSASVGLLILGLATPEDAVARTYPLRIGRRTFGLSAWHLCLGAIVACAVPQALYLVTRNVDLVAGGGGPYGFRVHADWFRVGSGGGNCGEPGNAPCSIAHPVHALEPFVQGLFWLAGTAAILVMNWKERRTRALLFLGAWLFAALSTIAKGPAGFGLPILCGCAAIVTTRRWRTLVDMKIGSGLLVILVVGIPWYVAAYVRHGSAFTDELIFHDMFNRAFGHVHDTNEGADTSFVYYLGQLGYGLFPWTALVPLALVRWMRRPDVTSDGKGEAAIVLAAWAFLSFALFSFMGTKFHHYIFPAVPPLALLVGIAIDEWLTARAEAEGPSPAVYAAFALAGALLAALVARDLVWRDPPASDGAIHFAQLFSYQYRRPWPAGIDFHLPLALFGAGACLLPVLAIVPRARRVAMAAMGALACAFCIWCGDVYLQQTSRHWGQGDVLRAYYADRHGEDEPLVAYEMNWKGENFYSGNHLAEFVSAGRPFADWLHEQKARGTRAVYVVLEHTRVDSLKRDSGAQSIRTVTSREDSHQFVLVRAEL